LRCALAASAIALLGSATPALAQTAKPSTPAFVPTMADWMGVNAAIQRYRIGVEKHDAKALESAFWPDAKNLAVPSPGQEINIPFKASEAPGPGGPMPPPPNGGPPGAGGPTPNGPPEAYEVWHLPLDSSFTFESPTRATHYGYFLSIYPQKELKADGKNIAPRDARLSVVGWPGHYEDILEKRGGEWRILQRKSMINQK
jgi:hypothetical protein